MSAGIEKIASAGTSMVERFEQAGGVASTALDGISNGSKSAVSAVTGVAVSVQSLEKETENAAYSADALSEAMNDYSEAMAKASGIAEELSQNENLSADTKEALAKASEEAAQAMNELESAQQEAAAALEEYNALIDAGTTDLNTLGAASERAERAAEELAQAHNKASNATEELSKATEKASEEAESVGKKGVDAVTSIASAIAAAGITKAVKEIADALMEAVEAAAKAETEFAKLQTIAGENSMGMLKDQIKGLSAETGVAQRALSGVAYNAISAGAAVEESVGTAGAATKLATAGFTETSAALSVVTTAMNSYGDAAGEAIDISDSLIMVQNLGVTTVGELSSSMGKAISTASAYNVSLGNVESAYVSVTKAGINTAEGTTYISAMLTELGKESSTVAGIIREQTGQSFGQLMNSGHSLADVLSILYDYVNNDAEALMNLWGSQTAGVASAAIVNQGLEKFNENLLAIENSAGATGRAYATMANTTEHAQQKMQNSMENLQIAIGDALAPTLKRVYDLGSSAFGWMADFAAEHPAVVKALVAIGTGIGAVVVGITGFIFVTQVAIPAVTALGTAISTAIWPITLIAAGIAAVTAAALFLADAFHEDLGETEGMTAATREQYYEIQNLNEEYEKACEKYGETSEEASRLKYQVDDLTAAFEANRQTVEEFTAEVDSLCQSVAQVTDDFNNALKEISTNEVGTHSLIQKYEDLATQLELTGAQQKELEAVTKKLSAQYPDLAAQLDSAALSTEEYAAAMKRACEQEAEELRQQQAQDTYIEALAKRAELAEEIAKAEENIRLEQERMDDMSGWKHFWTGGEWDDLNAYKDALEQLQAAEAENDATIARIEQGWEDIVDAETAAANECISAEQAVSNAYENVRLKVEELCAAYDEAYQAALESFEGQFGLFDEAQADMDATVANAQAALDSQLAYWENYASNLEVLKNTSAEDLGVTQENYEALMALAQDGSEEAAGLAASMAEAINSGNAEAVAALANTVGEVSAKQQEIAAMTADWATDFSAQMDAIEQEMRDTIDGMNLTDEAAQAASATISSYANQIRAGKGAAVSAAEEVANAVTAALARANASINVNVNSSGSVPGHATGTTNAESLFLAGEQGPELVARPAAAYATGTTNSADYFIAGENGPELIIGEQGSTVFPTQETDRLIDALNERRRPLQILPGGQTESNIGGKETATEQVKRILLEIVGGGTINVNGSGETDKATILSVLTEYLKPVLMSIIQSEIYEEGELSYEF